MEIRPRPEHGYLWHDRVEEVGVCFVGRGPAGLKIGEAVRRLVPTGVEPAWLKQIHSADVLDAVPGCAGEADALVSRRSALALTVVTADCVPVLLAGRRSDSGRELAAVHAGWRGVAARVVPAALERLETPADEVRAWIGPAIGPCCYEVGEDVAAQVSGALRGAATGEVVLAKAGRRPHLDLRVAVESQLREYGVTRVRQVECCTRCDGDLCSYRRDGARAGRNLSLIYST